MQVRQRRIYEPVAPEDGCRVLVDRLWPRGISREAAQIDEWPRELAPSDGLRRWFGHDPARFDEFRRRYLAELRLVSGKLEELRRCAQDGPVTIVFAAKDAERSNAAVLSEALCDRLV